MSNRLVVYAVGVDWPDHEGLLLDGHPHSLLDLVIAAVFYYLYIYCNFSGFCDMAIGAAGLLRIHVKENFHFPLAANSVKDYWNRWHITLSVYMRDLVFWRLSKYLSKRFGKANSNHAIALSILTVFILIGAWHGLGWHYQIFWCNARSRRHRQSLLRDLAKEGARA